jgi:hypothetical protein
MKHCGMKTFGGVDVYIEVSFTSALVRSERSNSLPGHFIPQERTPDIHWIGGWMGLRAGLDAMEK